MGLLRYDQDAWREPKGNLPALTPREVALAAELRGHVQKLAGEIGERNVRVLSGLDAAAAYIEATLTDAGYSPQRQVYSVGGKPCANIDAELVGGTKKNEIVVIGAHYDSVTFVPGANDNGSGAAAVLALAAALAKGHFARTVRFVEFANEEPPHFQNDTMGSLFYARRCRERGENVVAMLSLETIGYYTDAKGTQKYPPPFRFLYPSVGNFVAFVGNRKSRALVRHVIARFRDSTAFPSEGAAAPDFLPGVGWSDHWAFWQYGYPGLMVTDTAPFRYRQYHTTDDTPDKLDYERTARVVAGIERVIVDLAGDSDLRE